jgi:hypothetical protein
MPNFGSGNSYFGRFTPLAAHQYIAFIAVYTDGTLTVINPSYDQETQTFEAMNWTVLPPVSTSVGVVGGDLPPFPTPVFRIFLGDASTMFLRVVDQFYNPVDLTNCSQIVVNLLNADGSVTQLELSASQVSITSPPSIGNFSVPISSAVSALLNVGELQDVDVTFTISGQIFTVPFVQALSVLQVG